MSTTTSSHFLQQTFVLATGRAANAAVLSQLSALVHEEGGSFRLVAEPINRLFGSLAAINGDGAMLKAIAFNGLGLNLSDGQAAAIHAQLFAAGIDTWARFFEFCIGLQNSIGQVLDNRADAAQGFNATLAASGKAELFTGATVDAAVANLLQNIGSSATSLSSGNVGLGALASKLTSAGILSAVVDGYVAGATVFVDANGDGQLSDGEYSTSTDASGKFVLPGHGEAGAVVAFGGTDLFTGKAFQGMLSALAGSTVVNPFTTLVQTLVSAGYSASIAQAVSAVQSGLGLSSGINLLTYDPMSVLASSTASVADKAQALLVQSVSLQLANVLTQLMVTIDAANTAAGVPGSSASHVKEAVASALLTASASGTLNLTSAAVLTEIVKTAAAASGASAIVDAASQIALVMAASNASAALATTTGQLSQAAVISQGAATEALALGASASSFESVVSGFTGANLNAQVSAAVPGLIAPGVTAGAALPSTAFVVTELAGVVSFSGPATGVITVDWAGWPGASVAVFTRAGAPAAVTPDFGGTATKVSLVAWQTLSGTVAQLKGLTIQGAGAVVLTDAAASAADLLAIDVASTATVGATSVRTISGTAAQIAAVVSSTGITQAADFAAIADSGVTTLAQANAIAASTSGVVSASISDTLANLAALTETGNNYTITVSDAPGTAMTAAALSALGAKTTGVVTVANAVAITGTGAELVAALFVPDTLVVAGTASVTVAGSVLSVEHANALAGKTSGVVTARVTGTLAELLTLSGTGHAYTIALTEVATPSITALALSTLGGQTTGVVTVTNAVNITGKAAEVTAALVAGDTLVVAVSASVTITDPAGTPLDAVTLRAIGAKTSGMVTVTHAVDITGTADEITAALVTVDTRVMAGTAKVAVTGAVSVAQVNAIAASTSGVVTAALSDSLANLTNAEAGNAYRISVTDLADASALQASALSALGGKTTELVTVANAATITGTAEQIMDALVTPDTRVAAPTAKVIIVGGASVEQVKEIGFATSGVVTATLADSLANLASLGSGNAFTIRVTDAADSHALSALALSTLGGKTSGQVTVDNAVTITGSAAQVKAALVAADTLVVAGSAKVVITGSASLTDAKDISARTSGVVTATLSDLRANLMTLEAGNAYTMNVTDADSKSFTILELAQLAGRTTGQVTVLNAVTITGSAAELRATLIDAENCVVAASAKLTIFGTSLMAASELSALGGKTLGQVTVANASTVTITGTAEQVMDALVTPDTRVAAPTAKVIIVGGASVEQVKEIGAATSGVVTATLADSLANLASLGSGNAFTIRVTDAADSHALSALALSTLGGKTSGQVTVDNAVTITGSAAQVKAALVAADTLVVAGSAKVVIVGSASLTDVKDISARTSGVVTATLSDLRANLMTLEAGNAYTKNVIDADSTSFTILELAQLAGRTTGQVTVLNAVTITGSAAELRATLIDAENCVVAASAKLTIGPGLVSVGDAIDISAKTSGIVTATLSDSWASLMSLKAGNAYTMTVTDVAGTLAPAWALSALVSKTTGEVTIANALAIFGTVTELTAALVSENTRVDAPTATVTVTDPWSETPIAASALSALGGKTTGVVTVTQAVNIAGTAAEVKAALVSPATKVVASLAGVTIAGSVTVTEANEIAATTTGAVTAAFSNTLANLGALQGTENKYTMTITDAAGQTLQASALNALAAKTVGTVNVANAVAISGTAAEVTAALVTATNLVIPGNTAVLVTGTLTVDQANDIDRNTSGVVTGAISDTSAATLKGLLGTGNAYTTTLAAGSATASDLNAIDAATTIPVAAGAVSTITGTHADVAKVIASTGITKAGNYAVMLSGASVTIAQANAIDAANGSGVITAVIAGSSAAELTTLTGTGNTYTITVTGNATAAQLIAIDDKTTVTVNASGVTAISGLLADVQAVISRPGIAKPSNFAVEVTDVISVDQAKAIDAANGVGVISAQIAPGLASTLVALTGTGNLYNLLVTGAATAADLIALDDKTMVTVNALNVQDISGAYASVDTVINSPGIAKPWNYGVNINSVDSISVAQANALDAANGSGYIQSRISDTSSSVLATLTGTHNGYFITVTGSASAADLLAIDAKTVQMVDASAVKDLVGSYEDVISVMTAESYAIEQPNYFDVTLTGLLTINQVNGLASHPSIGLISASFTDYLHNLVWLVDHDNPYTITIVENSTAWSEELLMIDALTPLTVNAQQIESISGDSNSLKSLYQGKELGTINFSGNETVSFNDSTTPDTLNYIAGLAGPVHGILDLMRLNGSTSLALSGGDQLVLRHNQQWTTDTLAKDGRLGWGYDRSSGYLTVETYDDNYYQVESRQIRLGSFDSNGTFVGVGDVYYLSGAFHIY